MVSDSKEPIVDMPDNESSGMAAEAIKEVSLLLFRLNGQLKTSKWSTRSPNISRKNLTRPMDPTGTVWLGRTSPPTSAMSPRIIFSSTRDRSQYCFTKSDDASSHF